MTTSTIKQVWTALNNVDKAKSTVSERLGEYFKPAKTYEKFVELRTALQAGQDRADQMRMIAAIQYATKKGLVTSHKPVEKKSADKVSNDTRGLVARHLKAAQTAWASLKGADKADARDEIIAWANSL